MFTRKTLNEKINAFFTELENNNFHIKKAILFGSYATGKIHAHSDIDLAIWIVNLPEKHWADIPALVHIVAKHHPVSPKFYSGDETKNDDPFIGVIQKTGKVIDLKKKIEAI
jgi:predicted nucleotidyltransferase